MTVASDNIPYFRGVARRRGRGLGALALSVARTAIPIFRNFIVPAAKKVGRDFVTSAVPELSDVISGKQSFKKALKSSAKKTIKIRLEGVAGHLLETIDVSLPPLPRPVVVEDVNVLLLQ